MSSPLKEFVPSGDNNGGDLILNLDFRRNRQSGNDTQY
jgi:hypothetical protein